MLGKSAVAVDLLEEALAISMMDQEPMSQALYSGNLACLEAVALMEDARSIPDRQLGSLDVSRVIELCKGALEYSRETGDMYGVVVGLLTSAALACQFRAVDAARLTGGASTLAVKSGIAISGVEELHRNAIIAALNSVIGQDRVDQEMKIGSSEEEDRLVDLAMSVCRALESSSFPTIGGSDSTDAS